MAGQRLIQSEYVLQHSVMSFRDLIYQLVDAGIIRTYQDVLGYCVLESMDYLVLRYLNTGGLTFEKWAEEWLPDGEV